MVINLITFASILHKQASVRSSHEVILTELEKYFTVNFIDYKDIDKLSPDDFIIIFIATGGVERLVIQHFESLPRPAILLADGMQNSLAAAAHAEKAALCHEIAVQDKNTLDGLGELSVKNLAFHSPAAQPGRYFESGGQ